MSDEILDSNFGGQTFVRRRSLLPVWIKIFTWIFLIFGVAAPFALMFGLLGIHFQLSLYGLETNDPISLIGLFLIGIFLYKGITAFGLWMEKSWAIIAGQIDAVLGIVVCIFVMFINPFLNSFKINIRLELLLLIPFLIKLGKIKKDWLNSNGKTSENQ